MSSSIWTRCAGDSEIRPLRRTAWRVVEAQHLVSTRKLVDSVEEQAVLEELIDRAKPPEPGGHRVHYLLFTPFRYPPLPHGSRFGARHEPGLWYGSESRDTAFTEVAYYRLLFLEGTSASLAPLTTVLSAFTVQMRTARGIDLVHAPFDAYHRTIASPSRYAATQALGHAMRAAGVELFRYPSAREPRSVNLATFTPAVFGKARPSRLTTWHSTATRDRVEFVMGEHSIRASVVVFRSQLLVNGELPAPAP